MTTVQWVLPQALFICVDGYKYILKSSNFTKVMWETQTELPLLKITQHSRPNPCHADVVSIVPHVRHYKFMPSSQASQVILLGKFISFAVFLYSNPKEFLANVLSAFVFMLLLYFTERILLKLKMSFAICFK